MVNHILNDTHNSSVNIYLRSDEAQESLASNHKNFFLNELISVNPDTHILVGLTNFDCPHSFYNINNTNNKIEIFYADVNSSPQLWTYLIPTGNYDINSLLSHLQAVILTTNSLTLNFNQRTNRLVWGNNARIFRFTENNTADFILGYEKDTPSYHYTSYENNVVNLGGTNSLYFRVKNLGIKNLNSFGNADGTIAKINVKTLPSEYIYYESPENFYFIVENQIIRSIEIEIVDDKHNPIDFNGGIFSCCLTLHFSFKRDVKFKKQYFLINPEILEQEENIIEE